MSKTARLKKVESLQPITIGCYVLTATGLEVHGKPTIEEHEEVFVFINRAVKASSWWVADWVAYGDTRTDWKDRIDHLVDSDHFKESSLKQYRYVAQNVPPSRRLEDVSFSVHCEVAGLNAKQQQVMLSKAQDERMSSREVRAEIRAAARTKVIKGQAKLEGMFRVIYADPPWLYNDSGATADGSLGKAERHYPGMTIDELCVLPVAAHALPDAVLFLWVTSPMLSSCWPVIEAWGFEYKASYVWDKVLGNYGHYNHVCHELLLICTRGSCQPDVPVPSPKSVQVIRRTGEHSEKPVEFRRLIETHWTTGPYLELFGRKPADGWRVFGNDARLWANDATLGQ